MTTKSSINVKAMALGPREQVQGFMTRKFIGGVPLVNVADGSLKKSLSRSSRGESAQILVNRCITRVTLRLPNAFAGLVIPCAPPMSDRPARC
jgi:hypothetical protein